MITAIDIIAIINDDHQHHPTDVGDFENLDGIIETPILPFDVATDLSPEFIGSTLDYFILSGERLSQMTKTYDDIDAVTRLLEEVSVAISQQH